MQERDLKGPTAKARSVHGGGSDSCLTGEGCQRPDASGRGQKVVQFSLGRTFRLFACACALLCFFVLVVMPSSAVLRLPPGMYKHIIYETFLNVVIVLLAVRGWRAHLAFVPIWLALLWFLWPTWPRH